LARERAGGIGVRVLPVPCFYHTPAGARCPNGRRTCANQLARLDRDNAEWQRELFFSHWVIADVDLSLKDPGAARPLAEAALPIAERLARQDPTNTWRDDIASARALVARLGK